MSANERILITGGAGFIGSHVVRRFVDRYPQLEIHNLDALTYAGNLDNLRDIQDRPNYRFIKGDIRDLEMLQDLFTRHDYTGVIHLAAESHVDRSIEGPLDFIHTNVVGTANLLEAARRYWKSTGHTGRFYHVSTDEVFGSLGDDGFFREDTPYDPKSPYSASKAGSDHLVMAYANTYGMDVVMSNCSNNFGPNQFPEKLIPVIISNIKERKPLPVYGTGENVRDWLWVEDHAAAIDAVYHKGHSGEVYCIGGENEWSNIDLVKALCDICDEELGREAGSARQTITFVTDRPGHDHRYAIDCSKAKAELDWAPSPDFPGLLRATVRWYLDNQEWMDRVRSGEYRDLPIKESR